MLLGIIPLNEIEDPLLAIFANSGGKLVNRLFSTLKSFNFGTKLMISFESFDNLLLDINNTDIFLGIFPTFFIVSKLLNDKSNTFNDVKFPSTPEMYILC